MLTRSSLTRSTVDLHAELPHLRDWLSLTCEVWPGGDDADDADDVGDGDMHAQHCLHATTRSEQITLAELAPVVALCCRHQFGGGEDRRFESLTDLLEMATLPTDQIVRSPNDLWAAGNRAARIEREHPELAALVRTARAGVAAHGELVRAWAQSESAAAALDLYASWVSLAALPASFDREYWLLNRLGLSTLHFTPSPDVEELGPEWLEPAELELSATRPQYAEHFATTRVERAELVAVFRTLHAARERRPGRLLVALRGSDPSGAAPVTTSSYLDAALVEHSRGASPELLVLPRSLEPVLRRPWGTPGRDVRYAVLRPSDDDAILETAFVLLRDGFTTPAKALAAARAL